MSFRIQEMSKLERITISGVRSRPWNISLQALETEDMSCHDLFLFAGRIHDWLEE
jgi:hypothetical protein